MYRSHRGNRKESEYTHTAAGVDPQILDCPLEGSRASVGTLALSTKPTDWSKYYEQKDLGMSTDILHTDEARQTTSLILQQASVMAAEGSDEMPLIFATQMTATIANLDIEGKNPDESIAPNVNTNVTTSSSVSMTMSSPERMQTMSGVPILPSTSSLQMTHLVVTDTKGMLSTIPSVATGASSVTSIVPYE